MSFGIATQRPSLMSRLGRVSLALAVVGLATACSSPSGSAPSPTAVAAATTSSPGVTSSPPAGQGPAQPPANSTSYPPGGGVASFEDTFSQHVVATNACTGSTDTTDETSKLTMVVTFKAGGDGTVTVDKRRDYKHFVHDAGCGGNGYADTTTTEAEHLSGAKTTHAEWAISPTGAIDFSAVWDAFTGGTKVTTAHCEPVACDSTRTEDTVLEFDNLSFNDQGDPGQKVISGSRTEDRSSDDFTHVIVYRWSLDH